MTSWAERDRDGSLWRDYERQQAERVACPECAAPVGETCRDVHNGQPLGRFPAHWRRIKAADQAAAEETQP